MYFTLNTNILKDLQINSELHNAGLPNFKQITIGTSLGLNFYVGTGFFNIEGGVASSLTKKQSGKASYFRYIPASLNYFIRVLGTTETPDIFVGVGYNFTAFNGDVFAKSSSIDLNNISQNDLQGALNLNAISHGIAFSLLFSSESRKGWSDLSVMAGYILDLSKPKWKSESANLSGSFSENFSRFTIALIRPIKRWSR